MPDAGTTPPAVPDEPPTAAAAPPGPVSEAAVDASLAAVPRFWKDAHAVLQAYPSGDLARVMLEAAAPFITGDIAARLERAEAALAGDNEGVRLWMLDCGELVAKHRARAEAAEAKLAAITDACRSIPTPIAERILGIIGTEEEDRG